MAAPCWKLLWVDMSVDSSSWEIRNEPKLSEKYEGLSVYLNSKETSYHYSLKRRKTLSSAVHGTRT